VTAPTTVDDAPAEDGALRDPGEVARPRAVRLSLVAGGAFLALALLSSFLPGGGGQGGGSPSSSYSNRADGTAAWAELLSRFGHHVDRLRGDLEPSTLDPAATVVVLDAPGIGDREARALGAFVRRGGRLVAGGAGSGGWLESVIDRPPDLSTRGVRRATPVGTAPPGGQASAPGATGTAGSGAGGSGSGTAGSGAGGSGSGSARSGPAGPATAPEVEGVGSVRAAQLGSWRQPGQLQPILAGEGDRVLALAGDVDAGRVVALADPSPVQNGLLAADDDAALALGLAGGSGRAVLFAEGPHGYGQAEGLAALPRRWRLALAGLGLAAAVWLLARSRRLGPPEDEARALPPPRWAYVEAVAATLARTRQPREAVEPVRRRARELIARRAGLPADADRAELHRAALRLGLAEDEATAALGGGTTDGAAVLAAGRALARLAGGER